MKLSLLLTLIACAPTPQEICAREGKQVCAASSLTTYQPHSHLVQFWCGRCEPGIAKLEQVEYRREDDRDEDLLEQIGGDR